MPNSSEKPSKATMKLDCNQTDYEQFRKTSKIIVNQIKSFNTQFTQFLEQEKKSAKELVQKVAMYNSVDRWVGPPTRDKLNFHQIFRNFSGGPLHDPTINIEHLLQYFLVNIQDTTKSISSAL